MVKLYGSIMLLVAIVSSAAGQPVSPAEAVLNKSIAYHGMEAWGAQHHRLTLQEIRCRFYHDEGKNDGEYIVFEGEVVHDGLRLPRKRSWFMNAAAAYLGADVIEAYERLARDGP